MMKKLVGLIVAFVLAVAIAVAMYPFFTLSEEERAFYANFKKWERSNKGQINLNQLVNINSNKVCLLWPYSIVSEKDKKKFKEKHNITIANNNNIPILDHDNAWALMFLKDKELVNQISLPSSASFSSYGKQECADISHFMFIKDDKLINIQLYEE